MKISDILFLLNKDIEMKNKKIKNIKLDSRLVEKDDVFIDLSGNEKYIKEAIKKNACLIITELNSFDKKVISVDNIIDVIGKLSYFYKNNFNVDLIGITGSCGKTTTKELLYQILSKKYKVLKSDGNNNNNIGVPKTLFKLDNTYDICILEMGMNHKGEINKLSHMCNPNIGIITNIGSSHIGMLNGKKNILKSKLEILNGMKEGLLIVNGDDKYLKRVKYKNKVKIGVKRNNNFRCNDIKIENEKLIFNINNSKYVFNIPNKNLIINVLISIYIGLLYNVDIKDIKDVLTNFKGISGRSHVIKKDDVIIIDDTYNASLESLISGLDMVSGYNRESIIVIGDIKEIDGYEKKIYKRIQKKLKKFDNVLLLGEGVRNIKGNYKYFDTLNELLSYINNLDLKNKILYLKASNKMNLNYIVDKLLIK